MRLHFHGCLCWPYNIHRRGQYLCQDIGFGWIWILSKYSHRNRMTCARWEAWCTSCMVYAPLSGSCLCVLFHSSPAVRIMRQLWQLAPVSQPLINSWLPWWGPQQFWTEATTSFSFKHSVNKSVNNAHHNFPEPKVTSSNCFFCTISSAKPIVSLMTRNFYNHADGTFFIRKWLTY